MTRYLKDIVDEINRTLNKGEDRMQDRVLRHLLLAHDEICSQFQVATETFTINVTAGVTTYPIHASVRSVVQCRYHLDEGSSGQPLIGRDFGELYRNNPYWESDYATESSPVEFMVHEHNLRLIGAPDTSTDGTSGFPHLQYVAAVVPTLFTGTIKPTDEIPAAIRTGEIYRTATIVKLLEGDLAPCENMPQIAAALNFWEQKYLAEQAKLRSYLIEINQAYTVIVQPSAPPLVKRSRN